jgi:hypothetical protein
MKTLPLLFIVLLIILFGCQSVHPFNSPTLTAVLTQPSIPRWMEYEKALSKAVVNTDDAFCEWEILGTSGDEVYVWTLCKVKEPIGTAGSGPVVIQLGDGGKIEKVTLPRDGNFYPQDIQILFPKDIQNKIFHSAFNVEDAEKHIDERLINNGPPLIAIEETPLP